jgi:hypothetical protein
VDLVSTVRGTSRRIGPYRASAIALFVATLAMPACGTIRSHRQVEQPLASDLTTGVGGTFFRLNKVGDLPNAFGGRDIWGGKVDVWWTTARRLRVEARLFWSFMGIASAYKLAANGVA